jgi:hypothetical protein
VPSAPALTPCADSTVNSRRRRCTQNSADAATTSRPTRTPAAVIGATVPSSAVRACSAWLANVGSWLVAVTAPPPGARPASANAGLLRAVASTVSIPAAVRCAWSGSVPGLASG